MKTCSRVAVSETDCFTYPRPALSFGQWGAAALSAHSWIRHCPRGSSTEPYCGLPQSHVLSPKANYWLYTPSAYNLVIRTTKFKTPSI